MSMPHPHQNININISYNLGSHRSGKAVTGKNIIKSQKATCLPIKHQCDMSIKLKMKKSAKTTKKNQQIKPSTQSHKHHRKNINTIHRNSLTADLIHERKVCTEVPSAEMEVSAIFKRESKSKSHFKSAQPASSGKLSHSRLKIALHKTSKSLKEGRTYQQLACHYKKLPIDIDDSTTLFQTFSTISKKNKANSPNFFGKDRVVSKLLNISLLASELSNSQPITSERVSRPQSQSVCLKQYMSSIDMRLISRMQNDVPVFAKKQGNQQNYTREIMLLKGISLEQLISKIIKVQRFWKGRIRKRVVNKYKSLFRYVTDRFNQSQKSQISAVFAESVSSDSHCNVDIGQNLHNRRHCRGQGILQEDEISDDQLEWVKQQHTHKKIINNKQANQLKIAKQNQNKNSLSGMSDKKQEQKDNLLVKTGQQHLMQWNSINKKISKVMKDKKVLDSASIMDELIKQSDINQRWIEEEENPHQQRGQIKSNQQNFEAFDSSLNQEKQRNNKHDQELQDGLQESVNFNLNHSKPKCLNNYQTQAKRFKDDEKSLIIALSLEQSRSLRMDQTCVVQHVTSNNVVQNYLQCEFENFQLNLGNKDHRNQDKPSLSQQIISEDRKSPEHKSIQMEGQKSNRISFNKMNKGSNQIFNNSIQKIVDQEIQFLLCEFSNDISNILKKSTAPAPQKPVSAAPRVVRPPCIDTNHSSIKDYIDKFILFIQKSQTWISRITDSINKNIGPSSRQILSYLRPQEDLGATNQNWIQDEDDQEGVFVIPAECYEEFENQCQEQYRNRGQKEIAPRVKAYLSFWHRCIFESFNQCLDYERPYGILGKPYQWTTYPKIFRKVIKQKVQYHLNRGKSRLLELAQLVGGIIFEKIDSPFSMVNFNEEQRQMMNQQRLSRILATELLQSEQSWVNYNDQNAQLMVQLARTIEDRLFFQAATELKKLQRRRKMIQHSQQSLVEFSANQL